MIGGLVGAEQGEEVVGETVQCHAVPEEMDGAEENVVVGQVVQPLGSVGLDELLVLEGR